VNILGQVRRRALGLSLSETSCNRRRFRGATSSERVRLESIGAAFLEGYHAASDCGQPKKIGVTLAAVDLELRGFAFEGAAMGFALLDQLIPWGSTRISRFLQGGGDAHAYMVHVAVGWVWARLPLGKTRVLKHLNPLLSWLAFDGWGFHEGFFHWTNYIKGQAPPWRLDGYEKRVFDQGLGRSFWFVNGGNPDLIMQTMAAFPVERHQDLWSGIGLAAVYAGIAELPELLALRQGAGESWPALAQGATFACKARARAGNSTPYTDLATRALCDMPVFEAAQLTDSMLENLPMQSNQPAYETWRQRIQRHFQNREQTRKIIA